MPSNDGQPSHDGVQSNAVETHVETPFSFDDLLQAEPSSNSALVVLELCAGSAMLSAILKRDGFDVIPHRPHVHVLSMDLRLQSNGDSLDMQWLQDV